MMRYWRARHKSTNEVLEQGQLCNPDSPALETAKADLSKRYAGQAVYLDYMDDSGVIVQTISVPSAVMVSSEENPQKYVRPKRWSGGGGS